MSATAELIADGGAAAAGPEFFRSPEFLAAEGVTHTLRIAAEGVELLAPLLVREIPGAPGRRDAVSPYGYPGLVPSSLCGCGRHFPPTGAEMATTPGGAVVLDPAEIELSATGLVSVFLRHTLEPPPLAGASERNVVQIADPALPRKSRPSDRRQIRRNLEAGYTLALVPGPETTAAQRAGFLAAYEQTMVRTEAAQRYFFAAEYFERLLSNERTWLAIATAPGGEVAAASLAALSDGYLHYYLSGTADPHLGDSPMKNVVAALCDLAEELELPLCLGGGLRRGDALEEFKRGFANRELPWCTSELIADPAAYAELSAGRDAGGFFPAYRAP